LKPGRSDALNLAGSIQFTAEPVDFTGNDAIPSAINAGRPSAAAELKGRNESSNALSMMVSSMVHMVQAGQTKTDSHWSA
jgi:hypothetical protein